MQAPVLRQCRTCNYVYPHDSSDQDGVINGASTSGAQGSPCGSLPASWSSVGVILTHQQIWKSTMGLSIRPRQCAGSRQGSSQDIFTAFPGIKQGGKGSSMGLINRLTVQWVLQVRVTCKDKVLTVTCKENCAKWRQIHWARQYRTTD
jgi:hypothetical protein